MARSRNWTFTINNYTEQDENWCWGLGFEDHFKYTCVGREIAPETGTPHLQGMVCWTTMKSFGQMKSLHEGAHWEAMRESVEVNMNYCKKGDDFYEWGEAPMTQKQKGEANLERWEAARECVRQNRIGDIPADLAIHLAKLEYAVAREKLAAMDLTDTETQHEWLYGKTRTGKSRKARFENPGAYLKMCNKWWDGYMGEEVVLIEDLDKKHDVLCHHLKIWGDRYRFPAEVKGGKIDIRPRKIVVTSNWHPADIWEDERDLEPILRRFRVEEVVNWVPPDEVGGGGAVEEKESDRYDRRWELEELVAEFGN